MSNISFIKLAEDIVIDIMIDKKIHSYGIEDSDLNSYDIDGVSDNSSIEEILVFMLYDGHNNNFSRTHKIVESNSIDLSRSTKNVMRSLMSDVSDLYFEISQIPNSAHYRQNNISNNGRKHSSSDQKKINKTEVLNKVRKISKKYKKKIEDDYNIYSS
jgi:hypothetical protein